jgi:Xaa-Pro aminopeptidase/Xaa-Pro dipeptidase
VRGAVTVSSASLTDDRVTAVRRLLDDLGLDAILLTRSAHKRYFSGFKLGFGEEATSGESGSLLITRDAQLILADSRYAEQAAFEAPDFELVNTVGPLEAELPPLLERHAIEALGLEAQVVPHATWAALAAAAPGAELHQVDDELVPLRIIKSAEEIASLEAACSLTDACFAHLIELIRPGMTERQVAWELETFFRSNGADGLAFEPIVLAGARAAMPHGHASEALIEAGNVLLIDFGCAVDGYRSDMTRTLLVGDVPEQIRAYHDAVREAQALAIGELVPGVDGRVVDGIARRRIEAAGVEPYGHGLGHGIGLETHEPPRLRRTESHTLQAGMVFSVEPGIYLPGVTGIRIEDIVVLEESGPRLLTTSPREALVVQ